MCGLLAEIVDEVEAERGMTPGTTRFIAMVETAAAFFRIAEIARAHPRLCAITLGAEDFALSAGILPEAEGLFMPKQMAVFAARAAGIMPLGFIGTVAEYHDLDGRLCAGSQSGGGLVTWKLCRLSICRIQFCNFGCSAIGSRPSGTLLK
jgi:citrate lyase beta subunit